MLLFLVAVFAVGCFEGPTGPPGEDGKNVGVGIYTGTLTPGDLKGELISGYYWQLEVSGFTLSTALVTVHVRKGSSYAWETPRWSFGDGVIYIFKDNLESGYEYRIAVAK